MPHEIQRARQLTRLRPGVMVYYFDDLRPIDEIDKDLEICGIKVSCDEEIKEDILNRYKYETESLYYIQSKDRTTKKHLYKGWGYIEWEKEI